MARRKKTTNAFGLISPPKGQLKRRVKKSPFNFFDWQFKEISNLILIVAVGALIANVVTESKISIGVPLIMIGLLGGTIFVGVKFRRWWLRKRWFEGIEMRAIDQMVGHEFEQVCGEIYRKLGYSVKVTKRSRDQGADLILEGPEGRVVVQAKRQASSVGNWAVQEIVAAKGLYKAEHAVVITNSTYTAQARELAKANVVLLVDRGELARMLAKATTSRI